MKTTNEQLTDWIISRIRAEFKDDIGLLIGEESYKLDIDAGRTAMSFFFPASEKANKLARTFIIDGIGYDLFPMSWERMERIAGLEEDNAAVLMGARILYTGNEKEKNRFIEIQSKLKDNLANAAYTYRTALEKVAVAMELYRNLLFEDSLYKVRKASGLIIMYLSNAVAYANQTFLKRGHMSLMSDISAMKSVPRDFVKLIRATVNAGSIEELKQNSYSLVHNTRQYLDELKQKVETAVRNRNFNDLAAWYHELSYHWREIYHFCDAGEAVKAFLRSCYLQSELDIVSEEFGLGNLDLLGKFNADNLASYRQQAASLEKQIRSIIAENNASVDEYPTISDFLSKNS